MPEIYTHQTNETNKCIELDADERGNGNASHKYVMRVRPGPGRIQTLENLHVQALKFQDGPIAEVGVNGITNEVLYAILIDRLEGWQAGEYACENNAIALEHVRAALQAAEFRTAERVARGVEGTHEV